MDLARASQKKCSRGGDKGLQPNTSQCQPKQGFTMGTSMACESPTSFKSLLKKLAGP
jgi:hypothetical protein